jgi:very-short-patch-repair endonuclease
LWQLLRNRQLDGWKFRRQHPVGKYILDLYCHEAKFGIELDGGQHAEPDSLSPNPSPFGIQGRTGGQNLKM